MRDATAVAHLRAYACRFRRFSGLMMIMTGYLMPPSADFKLPDTHAYLFSTCLANALRNGPLHVKKRAEK